MENNNPSFEERLQVSELLSRYCHAMDAGRADLCATLFAKDARLDTPVGVAEGRQAIQQWMQERIAQRPEGYRISHYLLNPIMAKVSIDCIRMRSMLIYTRQLFEEGAAPELLSTGIYEDEVRLTNEGWQFMARHYQLAPPLDDIYFLKSQSN
jgi:hypothetical protein